jgi:copper(I)-binding protein
VSRKPLVRPYGAVAGAVLGAMALAGCGAGQVAQTAEQVAAVTGANANVGQIAVRDVSIVFPEDAEEGERADLYPAGGTAPLQMSIVNFGSAPDRLVSASSPAAASVQINGASEIPAGQNVVVEGEAAEAAGAGAPAPTPTGGPVAPGAITTPAAPGAATPTPISGLPSRTAAPTGEPSPQADQPTTTPEPREGGFDPAGPGEGTIEDPSATDQGTRIALTGLREDIRAGLTYPVVLRFERAGELRIEVPVANSTAEREIERLEE